MSVDAAGQDILSILRMFSSPRMGPFENTNAPAPQPPPAALANAQNSGNERQSEPEPSGPPQPVARKVVPPADAPAAGAQPIALKLPPGSSAGGEAAPGLATQPPVAAGTNEMPDFVSNNVVWQAWEKQRQRLYQEAQERQRIDLSAQGFGDIARAAGGTVTGGIGSQGGGGITQPGSSAATGQSALTLEQFSGFKKAQDDAAADAAALGRIKIMARDPKMAGMSENEMIALYRSDPAALAKLIAEYNDPTTETFTREDGTVLSRRKNAPAGTEPVQIIGRDELKTSKVQTDINKTKVDTAKVMQDLIDPVKANSPETIKQISELTNTPIGALMGMSPEDRAKHVQEVMKARETSQGGERVKLAGAEIKEYHDSNATMKTMLSRNAVARASLESGKGILGGGFTQTEIENYARKLYGRVTGDLSPEENQSVLTAATAQNALDIGQRMKGSFSDKDIALLRQAAGGDINMTAAERMRIIAMSDLAARFTIDENNKGLMRAGKRINEDRSDELVKPARMSTAELREINPGLLQSLLVNPEAGRELMKQAYGDTATEEVEKRIGEIVDSKLYRTPSDKGAYGDISHARTEFQKDAADLYKDYSSAELETRRDSVIQQLDSINPGEGANIYALMLAAKQGGHYGNK